MTQCGYHLIETISSFPIGRGISTSPKSEQTGPHCLITIAAPADSWYMDSQGNGGRDFSGKSLLHLFTVDLRVRGGPGKQGTLSKSMGTEGVGHMILYECWARAWISENSLRFYFSRKTANKEIEWPTPKSFLEILA